MKPHPELVDWVWYRARRMKEAFHGYVHQSSPRFRRPTDKRALPRGVSIVSLDDQERGLGRITWRLERRSIDPHFLYGVLRFGLLHPAEVVVTYDPEHTAELDPRDLSPDPRARW